MWTNSQEIILLEATASWRVFGFLQATNQWDLWK